MLKVLILWAIAALNVYLVYAGNTQVCGDGLGHREAVCIELDGYNYCTASDDYGYFCIDARRQLQPGETFPVWSTWSGETAVSVLHTMVLPLMTR